MFNPPSTYMCAIQIDFDEILTPTLDTLQSCIYFLLSRFDSSGTVALSSKLMK